MAGDLEFPFKSFLPGPSITDLMRRVADQVGNARMGMIESFLVSHCADTRKHELLNFRIRSGQSDSGFEEELMFLVTAEYSGSIGILDLKKDYPSIRIWMESESDEKGSRINVKCEWRKPLCPT